jgi:hypothetical protein
MANQYTKKKLISQQNRKEIFWNIVNALLVGGVFFLGSLSSGTLTFNGIFFGLITAIAVALTRFKKYWDGEEKEYCKKIFNIVG